MVVPFFICQKMEEINGIYFVGYFGLFKVFCEFQVLCINRVRNIQVGDVVNVSSVKSTPEGDIVYEIQGGYYYHYHFVLDLNCLQ